ncbi:hypothetical protein DY000_02017689 [Brassica cretica]|uniref:TCP domain-containing protein n=1 Tax=Brassica cretica TaxID=69181 RepID=A0ABQ7CQT6_BRACR|nr:hypothetical protein DY000_02017689 [Brassica cretica]
MINGIASGIATVRVDSSAIERFTTKPLPRKLLWSPSRSNQRSEALSYGAAGMLSRSGSEDCGGAVVDWLLQTVATTPTVFEPSCHL